MIKFVRFEFFISIFLILFLLVDCSSDKYQDKINNRNNMVVNKAIERNRTDGETIKQALMSFMLSDDNIIEIDGITSNVSLYEQCDKARTALKLYYKDMQDLFGYESVGSFEDFLNQAMNIGMYHNTNKAISEIILRYTYIDYCVEIEVKYTGGVIYEVICNI